MPIRIPLVLAATLAFALPAAALAQTAPLSISTPAGLEVQRLAPQLIAFAGSDANFQNLVNGLSLGIPVTLVTVGADGFTQTVTFTPAAALSNSDIARTLEIARQQLIARGVATPTAEQIGVTLAGGNLPTASGSIQVSGLMPTLTPGGLRPSASAGSSVRTPAAPLLGTINPPTNLVIDIRPTGALPQATSASPQTAPTSSSPPVTTSTSPIIRNTSDSPRIGNTSDSPALSTTGTTGGTTTTATGSTAAGNGAPSPAAQMQGRR
jgi:hypothetical protein